MSEYALSPSLYISHPFFHSLSRPSPLSKRSVASVSPVTISVITWLCFRGNHRLVPSVSLALALTCSLSLSLSGRYANSCVWDNIQRETEPKAIMCRRCLLQYYLHSPECRGLRRAHTHTIWQTGSEGVIVKTISCSHISFLLSKLWVWMKFQSVACTHHALCHRNTNTTKRKETTGGTTTTNTKTCAAIMSLTWTTGVAPTKEMLNKN